MVVSIPVVYGPLMFWGRFATQSLSLWREIADNMYKMWCLAEEDLLDESNAYRLTSVTPPHKLHSLSLWLWARPLVPPCDILSFQL